MKKSVSLLLGSGGASGLARDLCGTMEFDRAAEIIEIGYKKTEEVFN